MKFPVGLSLDLLEKARELGIRPDDIAERCVVGGGKGGQKINKTASCVMLKHGPTGTTVKCQKHRMQSRNKLSAYKLLILKIEDQVKGKKSERALKIFKLRKQKKRRSVRAKAKMMDAKSQRGRLKKSRGAVRGEE